MAKNCNYCHEPMAPGSACVQVPVKSGGQSYAPVPYGSETRTFFEHADCPDCNVRQSAYHHPGCDVEECPVCCGQLITCGCLDGDSED